MISTITRIQVEGNDTVSFLTGGAPPYQYVQGMSQIMPQVPTYISYGYDSITITQDGSKPFQFSVYSITDVGGNVFTALTFQNPSSEVQARTIEIYRLLVTSIFKGCCECGNTEPECSIQYTAGNGEDLGTFLYDSGAIRVNYTTANNQDFSGLWPIIQDGSWMFVFSKTDPTVYGVYQLSGYTDGGPGIYAQFTATLLNGPGTFPSGTDLCLDVTSVGGSLVQSWQDTLNISSALTQDNFIDGGAFNFQWDNVAKYIINSTNFQQYTSDDGSGAGFVKIDPGAVTLNATGYIDIITPGYPSASTGWVLALDASGHVEYVEAGTGTISSIELIMPPAFTVSDPNPLTTDGTFTVTVDGTEDQYINGLGELADFPVYTVENGLHAFGGVPGEAPPDPFLFHLGGLLIEDTIITVTNGGNEYALGVAGLAGQDTQQPFGVSNLGNGGVATFQDYGSGNRPNPSVEIVGDVDLFQPLLELKMEGNLPAGGILTDRNALLRLKYDGDPSLASMSIDYQFKNDDTPPNVIYFIGCRLTAEVTNFTANDEQSKFLMQLFDGGSRQTKMEISGPGQLTLNEYATGSFSDGTTNINNALTYNLAVDNTGKVWKKIAGGGGGTVTSVGAAGLLTTTATNPFTVSGTVTTEMATNRLVGRYSAGDGIMQEIVIGSGLTLTGDTLTAEGGTGFDVEVNGTLIIPPATVLDLKSGTDIDVIHEGGGVVRFDYVGSAAGYNSDQGIYKDTSLTPETFMLGAPLGSEGGIAFQVDRYIYTDDFKLSLRGNPTDDWKTTDGSILDVIFDASTSGITAAGIKIDASAAAGKTTGIAINQGLGIGVVIDGIGDGIILYTDGAAISTYLETLTGLNSVQPSYRMTRQTEFLDPAISNGFGTGMTFVLFDGNSVVPQTQGAINFYYSDITPGTQAADMQFSVNLPGLGTGTPSLTLKGTNQPGQIQFNEYGTGAITGTPAYSLAVDSSGNVIEVIGSGPAPGLQDVITTDPVLTANNTITGTGFDLKFDQFANFEANAVSTVKAYTLNGVNVASLEINTVGSPFVEIFSTQSGGGFTGITLRDTRMEIKTPLYATKAVGDVLTLVDPLTGEAEWQVPSGATYTADNGLTPTPTANNFQLGGLLLTDTTIDGDGNTYSLAFDGMYVIGGTASFKTSFTVNDGTSESILAIQPAITTIGSGLIGSGSGSFAEFTDTQSRLGYLTPTQTVQFGADGTGLYVRTPDIAAAAATVGQVLTLQNATTGEAEWQDAPGGGGIPFGVATGTDTYAVSAGTETTYTDGDAYLVRFTNGNTGGSTLNVNSIGDADMYSNSDGPLIGGDIWAGAQMLCVYNSSLPGFQCIGTAPNSLFAYVTNAEATAITKGMAVFAFGGTGDRLTVKKALATGDSTSAQTVGIVYSASIGANQKGIIIIQGELVDVGLFPTSGGGENWSDGEPVYLSATTAGAVTRVKQYAPNHLVYLGICVKASNGTGGRMYVRIQNGFELDELHNVQAQTPADKDTLWYDNTVTPKQWKTASVPSLSGTFSIGVTVDGSGGTITVGQKGYVQIPYSCTITGWRIITNATGVLIFDVDKAASGTIPTVSITGSAPPTLGVAQQTTFSSTLTGWTTSIAANDMLGFTVDSATTVSWAILQLFVTKS